ncbi:MAG: hypothetical protein OXM54_02025 [Acidimicrobiaceae bacterium]|nr:hypothetical protein [Acidimicrobiaceae bacterium]MDE0318595.1 hypothetical protein [Acidimicrobiaceae bacterium]
MAAALFAGGRGTSGDPLSDACEQAAATQALAELHLGDVLSEHTAAHEAGAEHDDGQVVAARVDTILAEARTRQYCG